jgi:hypothetical protein
MAKDEETPLDLSPDYEGIPDTIEGPPPDAPLEIGDQGISLPRDWAKAAEDNVTAAEQRTHEPLEDRVLREDPEPWALQPDLGHPEPEWGHPEVGRLVEPDSEVDRIDVTADAVASEVPESGPSLTEEEAAVHLEDERPDL